MSFFPKIMMGPITLYSKFSPQLKSDFERKPDYYNGITRFVVGLGKKVLIADSVGKISDKIFAIPSTELTSILTWLGAITYALQIYFDFSGYSDMAIGIGKILGFEIPENFNYPYVSESIKDFWKRWHITLANWLQTYLFLPVAYLVMRKIKKDKFLFIKVENIAYYTGAFITMLLCGLWHGANWTFVIWGIYYGLILIAEHAFLGKILRKKLNKRIRVLYSIIIILIGWVIFRSPDISYASEFIKAMFGFGSGENTIYYPELYLNGESFFIIITGILASFPIISFFKKKHSNIIYSKYNFVFEYTKDIILLTLFTLSILAITAGSHNPFIYAEF
jgi:alginate O-acetyltransferase complex protein AlgI